MLRQTPRASRVPNSLTGAGTGVECPGSARFVAFLGVGAYRTAFGLPTALVGPRPERLGASRVWVLPNPSGLNAHYQIPALIAEFERLRRAVRDRSGRER